MAPLPPMSGRMAKWARHAAAAAGGTLVTTGALMAAVPSVISTPQGLQMLLRVTNSILPGRIEVESASLGWTKKVQLRGIRFSGTVSSEAGPLVEVGLISTTATLWQLLSKSGPVEVTVTKPVINCEFDLLEQDFKLIQYMEAIGLLDKPPRPSAASTSCPLVPAVDASEATEEMGAGGSVPGLAGRALPAAVTLVKQGAAERNEGPPSPNQVVSMLSKADSSMDFTADVRLPGDVQFYIAEGKLLVPNDMRLMVGPHLHMSAVLGMAETSAWASEVGEDMSWTQQESGSPSPSAFTPGTHNEVGSPNNQGGTLEASVSESPTALSARLRKGKHYAPGLLQLHAQHLTCTARVWHDSSSKQTLLHEPACAQMEFTPQFSRFGLSTVTPILGKVANLRSGQGSATVIFIPERMQVPYKTAVFQIAPMKLSLHGSDSVVSNIAAALGISSASALQSATTIEASLSQMDVKVTLGGAVETKRVDVLIGRLGTRTYLPLSLWGTLDPLTDTIDMVVGLPAAALTQLGLSELPDGYLLQIPLRGTTDRPVPGLRRASTKLLQLFRRQAALLPTAQSKTAKIDGDGKPTRSSGGWLSTVRFVAQQALAPDRWELSRIEQTLAQDMANVASRTETCPWGSK